MPDEVNSPSILFWRRPTLAQPVAVLPSGLQRFTSVFGMGTGGATALLSPECGTALAFRCCRSDASTRPILWGRRPPYNFSPRSATAATTFSKEHDFQSAIANRKSAILVIL